MSEILQKFLCFITLHEPDELKEQKVLGEGETIEGYPYQEIEVTCKHCNKQYQTFRD